MAHISVIYTATTPLSAEDCFFRFVSDECEVVKSLNSIPNLMNPIQSDPKLKLRPAEFEAMFLPNEMKAVIAFHETLVQKLGEAHVHDVGAVLLHTMHTMAEIFTPYVSKFNSALAAINSAPKVIRTFLAAQFVSLPASPTIISFLRIIFHY